MINLEIIKNKKGQSMIMLAVTLGAIVMAALALSSFLNIIDLREVTDTRLSQAAIFSADTGIECALLHEFNSSASSNGHCPVNIPAIKTVTFDSAGKPVGQFGLTKNNNIYTSTGSDPNNKTSRTLQIILTKQQ